MKLGALILLSCFCFSVVTSHDDFYFWKYFSHPYQTFYLEDYCGALATQQCDSEANTVYLNSTGSGSAVVIRGFRASKPSVEKSAKCCITLKTNTQSRFNVQLDEVYLKQKRNGERCENFLRFRGLDEELGHICSEAEKYSLRTLRNVLEVEYVLDSENALDFQKIKLVVTAATQTSRMPGGRCSGEKEQWQCDDHDCIWEGFRCDAHNNCGDWSDELYCGFISRHLSVFFGVICLIITTLLVWCLCRCCCRCICRNRSRPVPANKPFQFVTSLGPKRQPMPQQNIYPSLDVPYQNSGFAAPVLLHGAPPPYNENALLNPSYNPSYGTSQKS